ncbi:MAG: T9SS type A sorting domain-containing protein [Crocinitomicaceae bacterium]
MKKSLLILSMVSATFISNSQTVLIDEDFESYTASQQLAQQSSIWETWSGSTGGADDAYVSADIALSGTNSLRIYHDNDMILPIGNYNSGQFVIELNAYMIEEAYFNIMHTCKSSWAFDLYITSSNEIVYLDEPNAAANNVVIDSYAYNQWVNFRFEIDIDLDSVTTFINNVKRHQSVFSNAVTGSTGSGLTCLNFYGLAGFNGVDHSDYYIDDILITQLNTADVNELETPEISIFPNPTKGNLRVSGISVEDVQDHHIRDVIGNEINYAFHSIDGSIQIELGDDVAEGMYFVSLKLTNGQVVSRSFILK